MDIMKTARLEFAQLHGAHSLDCARRIGPEKVIRVLWPDRYESVDALQREMELWADSCAWFLLDAGTQGGGHGVSLDWTSLASLSSPRPWFLAGGLSSASLNRALEQCSPDGIDLNSGVEATPRPEKPAEAVGGSQTSHPLHSLPHRMKKEGYFGNFGGRFVPEALRPPPHGAGGSHELHHAVPRVPGRAPGSAGPLRWA